MTKIKIFDKKNIIKGGDEIISFFPKQKIIKFNSVRSTIKLYPHDNSIVEYRIFNNPIKLEMRTIALYVESDNKPSIKYYIQNGVVLESQINFEKEIEEDIASSMEKSLKSLKRKVKWTEVSIFENYIVNLYVLSKHPDIISKEDYKKFLQQYIERIKLGIIKIENILKQDLNNVKIYKNNDNTLSIGYADDKYKTLGRKEREGVLIDIWFSDEKETITKDEKEKLKYLYELYHSLFEKKSSKYVGISQDEFTWNGRIEYIQRLLNEKK